MRFNHIPILLLLATALMQAQSRESEQAVLARAGSRVVTEAEFVRRFELTPGPNRHGSGLEQEKAVALYSLVAEKLLADEARRHGLDRDSAAVLALEGLRKVLARDELYRQEVAQRVTIAAPEVQTQARRALRELRVEYLYFEDSVAARVARTGLRPSKPLKSAVFDSSIAVLYDTVTVVWGEADTSIEDAAYQLKAKEISPVIRAGTGSYILRLLDSRPNRTYGGMQVQVLREKTEQIIRSRREHRRLNEFLAEALRGKIGYGRPSSIRALVEGILGLPRKGRDTLVALKVADIPLLYAACASVLPDTMAVAGPKAWETSVMIDRFCQTGFSYRNRISRRDLAAKASLQIRIWVEQELLEQEAMSRHLDESPGVRSMLETWTDSYLAGRMKSEVQGRSSVSDDEAWQALHEDDSTVVLPRVRIRELWTKDLARMQTVFESLRGGMTFEDAIQKFSDDPAERMTFTDLSEFPITDRPPIGAIAWRMEPGNWYGPVRERGGYVTFTLLRKLMPKASRDSTFQKKLAAERSTLLGLKKRGSLNYTIAGLAKRAGVSVFTDRLAHITVTRLPMVTFKVLGFGGRMFAVPFIDRQVEWLEVETSEPLP